MRQSFSSALMIKGWQPGDSPREIWIKRGAAISKGGKHSGPCGWKARASALRNRAFAEIARSSRAARGVRKGARR